MIEVSPITDAANPVPAVTVNSPESMITGKRYLGFGVRLYYAFTVSEGTNQSKHHRDTRNHRNRYLWR